MAKSTIFNCQNCGASYPKWQGQCDSCGEWGTIVEELKSSEGVSTRGGAAKKAKNKLSLSDEVLEQAVLPLSEIRTEDISTHRHSTGYHEFDRVLGGGMVTGGVMLLGGQPGIGKSTLLTQMLIRVVHKVWSKDGVQLPTSAQKKSKTKSTSSNTNKSSTTKKTVTNDQPMILYVCGEESPSQISLRINRILDSEYKKSDSKGASKTQKSINSHLHFVTTTNVDEVCALVDHHQPQLLVVDSIQTMTTEDLTGAAGSVGQVREATDRITSTVKQLGIPTFLVGHVTKDGTIAGPKVLEHIVDAVLELSGERTGQLRILRAIKNRFGATDEVGVFRMNEYGLEEVSNPSDFFLEHAEASVPGSVTACVMEGTRPLLIELQALVVSSQLAMPRRVGRGIELSRIQVLSAVLQKHAKIPLGSSDIFVNAAGGLTVKEPAADLGLALAMASSLKNKALPARVALIGEVGLLGEIRSVSYLEKRIKEAKRLGFEQVISRKSHTKVSQVLKELNLV